ncbi:MAG: DUF4157 domain-containing protein [Kofleriaceae bacterium]|nr:DUF4157 domain-containing protein [Kofleriaceae bacterium]MCL4224745.1 LysM peptidoglycan-binding domain-containing protein [Myxococcales bacterium]
MVEDVLSVEMRDLRRRDPGDELGEVYPTGTKPGAATLTRHLPVQRRAAAATGPAAPMAPFAFVQAYGGQLAPSAGAHAQDDHEPLFADEPPTAWLASPPAHVQRRDNGAGPGAEAVHQAAAIGTSGSAGPLPHLAAIQPHFGKHDVSSVRAYTDDRAAAGARAMGAEAYATGDQVAFAGSPSLHTAAHEAAHVVQQRGGVALEGGVGEAGDRHEQHADAVADRVVRGASAEDLLDELAGEGGGAGRGVQKVDQREGTAIPTAGQQTSIANELYPAAATVGGAPAPAWDGAVGQPGHLANRATLRTAMRAAMSAHLTAAMGGPGGINAVAAQPRVPISTLEGAGRAAKADADAQFSAWATAAALTAPQEAARATYAISADPAAPGGQNLFDAQDPAHRTAAGMGIDPRDLASWIAETDAACVALLNTHHLDRNRSAAERSFLRDQIVNPWAAANDADLRRYDQHGFAMSNPRTGQIVLPTSVPLGMSTAPGSGGAPSDAERARKWSSWRTMVHEYIHQLEHPTLRAWPGRNRTIGEGFCEYFTKKVLLPLLPTAGGADVPRRTLIEGADHGPPSAAIMGGPYDPGEYANYLARAEAIEGHLGGAAVGAQNAMKAIFFQGHVEFLGFDQAGAAVTAPAGPQDQITVPASLTTFATLATAVNVPEADLRAANPGVAEPLAGRVRAPGCREHRVVEARDAGGARAETANVIATQHDVTVVALTAANPGVSLVALTAGQVIIIPRH